VIQLLLPHQVRKTFFSLMLPCAALVRPVSVAAMDVRLGMAAIEGGDDRFQPAAGVGVTAPSGILGSGWIYGRDYGPVKERSYLLSGAQPLNLFGTEKVTLMFGVSVLVERTTVDGAPGESGSVDSSTNVGGLFGLRTAIYSWKKFAADATWESHIYPAGSQILLLVTGRKQVISLNVGVQL
jgi:hypothetical protein